MKEIEVSWDEVFSAVQKWYSFVVNLFSPKVSFVILGVSRGGIIPGLLLYNSLKGQLPRLSYKTVEPFIEGVLREFKDQQIILVDDILDTGATIEFFNQEAESLGLPTPVVFTVIDKKKDGIRDAWYVFPWETRLDEIGGRRQATIALLRSVGEDPLREGLKDTPRRVATMWDELCSGYRQSAEGVLSTTFSSDEYDEMVLLKDIRFFSTCEHHLLPFYGRVHFGYIPDGKVVGVSKIVRLVEMFSRRLQIQERMTMEIGKEFERIVQPKGVGVVVEGLHLCMMVRGVKRENATMVTSYLGGTFRENDNTRTEFLRLVGLKG